MGTAARPVMNVLRHEEHVVLEERALYFPPQASALSLKERGQDADRSEHSPHDIVDRGPRAKRSVTPSRHIGKTAHHLHYLVERGAVLVRPLEEAFVRAIDELGL